MDEPRPIYHETLISDILDHAELERLKAFSCSVRKPKTEEKPYPSLIEVIQMDMRYAENRVLAKFLMRNRKELFWIDPNTRLSAAACIIKRGNPFLIDWLLVQLKHNINLGLDWYNNTALQHAVQSGREQIVLKILKMGGGPNRINRCKRSAVHRAIIMDRPDILRMLLEYGGDINIRGPYQWRPIHTVFFSKYSECLDLILRYKPLMNACDGWHQNALSLHINFGIERISNIAKLLDNGSDKNFTNVHGYNYLHMIVSNTKNEKYFAVKAMELLLEHGIDINAKTIYTGATPLHFAIERNEKLVAPLLYYNSDLTLTNRTNKTPLGLALMYSEDSTKSIIAHLVLQKMTYDSLTLSRTDLAQLRNKFSAVPSISVASLDILKESTVIDFPNITYYDILTDNDYENARKLRNADFRFNVRRTRGIDMFPYYRNYLNMKIDSAFKLYEAKRVIADFLVENFHEILNLFIIEDIIDNFDKYYIFRLHRQLLAKMANI
ncbi:uncharacterized protein LOC123684440 [Harmonia axyridis]|uniref:uncharacterized protein LOC123684440 n=1 Tax=Harmonia axyridis TaxID=115357 RepID=UPI001E277847|nr:uncharacterized protein LOC123684440 [Harmonia axyridis]XP_045479661.1 uncharacterized protein LOC123684440 [Harmonia axyridis]XP_045479662.1 uncharacterized protein LOC123684440 [Harmonia axyridis]XP_045479664.1 uncharacterized protein LOC123684440 [Harmonia axyridis]XP_045479665.1 uncharacterized protein LOC123684440 [Harmonia axyridis]